MKAKKAREVLRTLTRPRRKVSRPSLSTLALKAAKAVSAHAKKLAKTKVFAQSNPGLDRTRY